MIALAVGLGATRYRLYIVHTASMEPTIPIRSAVVVDLGPVQVGEVISFYSHNGLVTHRLIAINPDGSYRTKGDANTTADVSSVPARDVVGHVVLAPRNAGAWLYYLKTPTGMGSLLCLALAAAIFVGPGRSVRRRHTAPLPATRSSHRPQHARRKATGAHSGSPRRTRPGGTLARARPARTPASVGRRPQHRTG